MEKIDLLATVDLFSEFEEKDLEVFGEHAEFYDFDDGEDVYVAGTGDRELFVIQSGEIRIVRSDSEHNEIDLARFVAGESFGEQDFMSDQPRTSRAVSQGKSRLLIFPSRGTSLDEVMLDHPEIFARVLHRLLVLVAGRIRSMNKLVSENSSWVQELRQQVYGDKLTGLYSRGFLDDELPGMLGKWRGATGLLMIKPDNFKLINDTFGHEVGDQVLRILANRLKALIGDDDIAVRFRGNEFVAILPQADRDAIEKEAERIRLGMQESDLSPVVGDDKVPLTFSVGVTIYPDDTSDTGELVERANETVFAARDAGGSQVLSASGRAGEDS